MFISQCLLNRMQGAVGWRQSLHGGDLAASGLDRQHQTRAHSQSINDDRASAAHAMLAADMYTGTPRLDTQEVT
jgi:hypothetical protein